MLSSAIPALAAPLTPHEAQRIAIDPCIYGYPLITSDITEQAFINITRVAHYSESYRLGL